MSLSSTSLPRRSLVGRAARWIVTLAVAGGALVYYRALSSPRPSETPEAPTPDYSSRAEAQRLRRDAARDVSQHRWADALRALDEARSLDPEGDALPATRDLREAATDGFAGPY